MDVVRAIDVLRAFVQRRDHAVAHVSVHFLGHGNRAARVVFPHLAGGNKGAARAGSQGALVEGLWANKAVDSAHRKLCHHIGRA